MNILRAFRLHSSSPFTLLLSIPFGSMSPKGSPAATMIIAHPTPARIRQISPALSPSCSDSMPVSPAKPQPIIQTAPKKHTLVNPPITGILASVMASFPTRLGNFSAISGTVMSQSMYL